MNQKRCRGKARYRDEIGAKFVLSQIRRTDGSRRPKLEQRIYKCRACNGFHLTSMTSKEYARA